MYFILHSVSTAFVQDASTLHSSLLARHQASLGSHRIQLSCKGRSLLIACIITIRLKTWQLNEANNGPNRSKSGATITVALCRQTISPILPREVAFVLVSHGLHEPFPRIFLGLFRISTIAVFSSWLLPSSGTGCKLWKA